ncbi:MAG: polysaccharide biosynthesis/export family protein [bacterium]
MLSVRNDCTFKLKTIQKWGQTQMRLSYLMVLFLILSTNLGYTVDVAETYRLQVDDVVQISLYGDTTLTSQTPVSLDGTISMQLIGSVQAEGRTLAEVARAIEKALKEGQYYIDPKISVTMLQTRKPKVALLGMVNRPGVYDFKPGDRVVDALSQASYIVADRADLRHATITHRDSPNESIPLDLRAVLYHGDLSQNYELQDGDVIFVPEDTQNRVFLLGEVMRPGQYIWQENKTVLDYISIGGDKTPNAKMSSCVLFRKDPKNSNQVLRFKLNLIKITNEGRLEQNIAVLPGDLINVPKATKFDAGNIYTILNTAWLLKNTFFSSNSLFRP